MLNIGVLACAAVLWLGGVSAGPCKPRLTSVSSGIETAVTETPTTSVMEIIETSSAQAALTASTGALTDEPSETTTSETTDIYISMSTTAEVSTTAESSTAAESSITVEASTTATTTTAKACIATNIIQNPDFDSPGNRSPWTQSSSGVVRNNRPRSAPNHVLFWAELGNHPISQIVPGLEPAQEYTFSYYWTFSEVAFGVDCSITVSAGVVLDRFSISANRFQYVERQFGVPANTITSTKISISAVCGAGIAEVLIDDVSMKPVCA
ncbi:unnamed protein product [Fusarium equiseti]|uniref:CBM-cenC domain-containing protein n=1 Tax=Fusarium equiseti TaxID=61235 RepID=A0A8J2IVL3_FUSEQ|nr:unnamed protein product [Fusarium equiseti]